MLSETRALDALLARLRGERRIWSGAQLTRPGDEWQLSVVEVVIAEPPDYMREFRRLATVGRLPLSVADPALVHSYFPRCLSR